MRYMMMAFSVVVMFSSQDLFASPKTDSIVAFLGGKQAKAVWTSWAWCKDDYTPKPIATAQSDRSTIEFLDTRLGTQRTLATKVNNPCIVRISKSGKWVTYIDASQTSYIVDLTSTTSTPKVLMAKASTPYWLPGAWWIDPTSGDEYLFCLDHAEVVPLRNCGGDGIVKVKVKSDGTVDHASKATLAITGLKPGDGGVPPVEVMMSVSADGTKLGAAFPWPDTKILDIPTGRLDLRHTGTFGCQTNLAPDNSYRLIHCEGEHQGMYMFAAGMVNTSTYIDMRKNLAGYSSTQSGSITLEEPRWTNDVQYFTASTGTSEGVGGCAWLFFDYAENDFPTDVFSYSAAQVKAMAPNKMMRFYLGKWSSDFKAQEQTMMIASDNRYAQGRGELWVDKQQVSTSLVKIPGNRLPGLSVAQSGACMNVQADGGATVRITDARGRLVRQVAGNGSISVDTRGLAKGAYFVSVHQQAYQLTKQVTIAR